MRSRFTVAYFVTLALLGGTAAAAHLWSNRIPEQLLRPLDSISPEIAGWKMSGAEAFDPRQFTATSYIARTYAKNGDEIGLLVAFHDSARAAVSVHSPKNCLPGDGWEIWNSSSPTVSFDGQSVTVNQYQIYRMDQRMTVLYWYQTRSRIAANEYLAKLMLARDGLFDHRSSGTFVRIALADRPDLLPDVFRFAGSVMHEVQRCFGHDSRTSKLREIFWDSFWGRYPGSIDSKRVYRCYVRPPNC
jgi:EpsI family protein